MTIKLDDKNYRLHDEKNKSLIKKSLEENGAGRSILIDSEEKIIAGNGVFEQAQDLKIPVKIIETDGKELIAIKRKDLKSNDKQRNNLAIFDNSIGDTSYFNYEALSLDLEIGDLEKFGITLPELSTDPSDFENEYDLQEHDKAKDGVKKMLVICPSCGHINEKKSFQKYDQNSKET